MSWLRIRDTSVSVLDVLELLAEGKRVSNILTRFPCLTESDIALSAEIARSVIVGHWALCERPEKVLPRGCLEAAESLRSTAWTPDEDAELIKLLESGATISDMTRLLLRPGTDIASRLERINKN